MYCLFPVQDRVFCQPGMGISHTHEKYLQYALMKEYIGLKTRVLN
jgi:hypothetical protein